jgi:hypothetical protein
VEASKQTTRDFGRKKSIANCMGVLAAGYGKGVIATAVTSLKVIISVIVQLANSETITSSRRKGEKRKTEQDILSSISAPREELLLMRLAFVRSSEATQVTGE